MKTWLRRLRGAFGMGLTWAAGWAPVGALLGVVLGTLFGGPSLGTVVIRNLVTFGLLGFVGGAGFSKVLWVTERERRFEQLTLPRFAAWGAVGGLGLGVLASVAGFYGAGLSAVGLIVTATSTVLGTASAVGTLAVARKAGSQTLPAGSEDLTDVGLTAKEKRELLGSGR